MLKRRTILQVSTGMAATSITGSLWPGRSNAQSFETLVERAIAAGEDRVVYAGPGGAFGNNLKEFFFDPFTAETGIAVQHLGSSNAETHDWAEGHE